MRREPRGEPLILCEKCHSFAVNSVVVMEAHRKQCDGKPKELLIRKMEEQEEE